MSPSQRCTERETAVLSRKTSHVIGVGSAIRNYVPVRFNVRNECSHHTLLDTLYAHSSIFTDIHTYIHTYIPLTSHERHTIPQTHAITVNPRQTRYAHTKKSRRAQNRGVNAVPCMDRMGRPTTSCRGQ